MLKNLISKLKGTLPGKLTFDDIRQWVGKEDPLIFEIGANDGTDTRNFVQTFPKGQVFAFEPDPRAIARWKETVAPGSATLVETAIGNSNGTITFHQSDGEVEHGPNTGWDLSGSIRAPKHHLVRHPHISFETTIEVPICTLDSWTAAQGIGEIDFIWADVQGAENDLIRGATDTLARTRFFYTEYDNREMYEGQWALDEIRANLPNHDLVARWKNDALFRLKSEAHQ